MPEFPHSLILILLSDIAFFMYGMAMASDYLQRLMANRVRFLMNTLADRPLIGIFVGIILTLLLQSSGAVTSMLVGLGAAGVVSLDQVMGVVIGSAIGSTFTVQIISFNIAQYGLVLFIMAFGVFFTTDRRVVKNISAVFMGFGLIFFGLELMKIATTGLRENPGVIEAINHFRGAPLLAFVGTALLTAFVQSSAVVIGIAMTLAAHNLISVHDAMYWIYGANVGTTATGIIAAMGGNYVGRQVAWAHFFYKMAGVALFALVTTPFVHLLESLESDPMRSIANAHTFLNLISAAVFYPFIGYGARLFEKYIQPSASERAFGTKFIKTDSKSLSMAYAQALRETLRMGDIVSGMVRDSILLFQGDDPDLIEDVRKRDSKVDLLFREIKAFLVKFSDKGGHLDHNVFELLSFITDLESAADIVDKSMVQLSTKKNNLKLEFSKEGWEELKEIHASTIDMTGLALSCFQLHDAGLAEELIQKKRALKRRERDFRERHLERLNRGLRATINTSSIHLEVMANYCRIAGLFSNPAYSIVQPEIDSEANTSQR